MYPNEFGYESLRVNTYLFDQFCVNFRLLASEMSRTCSDGCPQECRRHEYNLMMTKSDLPQHHFKEMEQQFRWNKENRSKTIQYMK